MSTSGLPTTSGPLQSSTSRPSVNEIQLTQKVMGQSPRWPPLPLASLLLSDILDPLELRSELSESESVSCCSVQRKAVQAFRRCSSGFTGLMFHYHSQPPLHSSKSFLPLYTFSAANSSAHGHCLFIPLVNPDQVVQTFLRFLQSGRSRRGFLFLTVIVFNPLNPSFCSSFPSSDLQMLRNFSI